MLGPHAAWWSGETALDGGAKHRTEPRRSVEPKPVDKAKDELFAHLRARVYHNPEVSGWAPRRRTDLIAWNDGYAPHASLTPAPAPQAKRLAEDHAKFEHVRSCGRVPVKLQVELNSNRVHANFG